MVHRGEDEVLWELVPEFDLLTAAHLREDHLDRQPGVIQTSGFTLASSEHMPSPFEGLESPA